MMNELIKVIYENDDPAVSARELHEKLGIKERFSVWWERNRKTLHLEETINYCRLAYTNLNNQSFDDYAVCLDIAKHICMVSGGEEAWKIRDYFIYIEKEWNSPEAVMARAIKMAEKKISSLQLQLEEQKPLVEFANTVTKSCDNILMRDMAKLLCDQHINIGEKKLYKLLRENGVLMRSNDPYQSYIDRGYFFVKETPYSTPYGEKLNRTTLVTPKGQIWIVSKVGQWLKANAV